MKSIFSIDSKFGQMILMAGKFVILSILWLICCIPVITWGAASSALYYCCHKVINKEDKKVLRMYFRSFKANFAQATPVGIVIQLICAVFVWSTIWMLSIDLTGVIGTVLLITYCLCIGYFLAWFHMIIAYIGRFKDKTKDVVRNTLYMAIMNGKLLLRIMAQVAICIIGVYVLDIKGVLMILPTLICLLPAAYCAVLVRPLERVFVCYLPQDAEQIAIDDDEEVPEDEEEYAAED